MSLQRQAKSTWLEIKGNIKEQWGKLTDDDLTEIDGSKDRLVAKLIDIYDMTDEEAKRQVDRFWD